MADENMASEGKGTSKGAVAYEAPKLTAIGNLRDLLAGEGSEPCDGFAVTAPGPDPFFGPGNSCGEG
jgi:hypothetical protein